MSADDHVALAVAAELRQQFERSEFHSKAAIRASPSDERPYFSLVRTLVNTRRLGEAEQSFQEAVRSFPSSNEIRSLHLVFHAAHSHAGRPLQAAEHAASWLTHQVQSIADNPAGAGVLKEYAEMMLAAFAQANMPEAGIKRLDQQIEILTRRLDELQRLADDRPRGVSRIAQLAALMERRAELVEIVRPQDGMLQRQGMCSFLSAALRRSPGDEDVLNVYTQGMLGTLGTLPDWPDLTCADDVIQMAIADLNQSDAMANDSLLNLHQKVEIMRRRLRVEQAHRSLVGSEAAHGTQLGFKNETPLSQTVDSASVVLHFWTPACASCSKDLGTVSHWQEKYGSAGLSVVSISADEQRATLEKLATDRRLRQTLATVPREGPWMTYYAVEFLPQLVLLDRQGRIRAIQVGNNPAKWRRFEQSIRSVLDEAAHRVTASGPEER